MASSKIVLSEEQFQCSICLDVFTDPVSIPCGHNFCMACIRGYWDSTDLYQCPMCKEHFDARPKLKINTFIAEMVAQLKKLSPFEVTPFTPFTPEQPLAKPGEVACDVCSERKLKALKSCLVCLTSYCETHLEPHQRVVTLRRHQLIDPVENLEDRVCKKHERPLKLFCRSDNTCVCQFCIESDHRGHTTVPIEKEFGERKVQLAKTESTMQKMIQDRRQKITEVRCTVEQNNSDAESLTAYSVQIFTDLVRAIERSQSEVIKVIEQKQEVAERQAEGFVEEMEKEITELERRGTEMEALSHIEDHLHLLLSSQSLCTLPEYKDWSKVKVDSGLCVDTVRTAVCEELVKLKWGTDQVRLRQSAVDVILNPGEAHPKLILSKDGKQVRLRGNFPNGLVWFDPATNVLGKKGFTERFYFEVQVKEKTRWILGVTSNNKRSTPVSRPLLQCNYCGWYAEVAGRCRNCAYGMVLFVSPVSPECGLWTVGLWKGGQYRAHAGPDVVLSLKEKPGRVGVYVDYKEGEVSFYDVEAGSLIYSFTGCTFTGALYPCFNTGDNAGGSNSAPLIICPVNHSGPLPLSRP